VQVWISYAYFEATPTDILKAELELEEEETEEAHAERIADMRGSLSSTVWQVYETAARNVYSRGFARMREEQPEAKAEVALLLEEWLRFERGCRGITGSARETAVHAVEQKVPRRVKKKRRVEGPEGADLGMEEYLDFVFPDEDQAAPVAKLLAAAKRWQESQGQSNAM
jgi:crooked neck